MVELGLEASVGDSKGSVDFLQKAFNVTLAADDELASDEQSEIVRVGSKLVLGYLSEPVCKKHAKHALETLDTMDAVLTEREAIRGVGGDENFHDRVSVKFALRQRANALILLGDLDGASVCVTSVTGLCETYAKGVTPYERDWIDSTHARLAWCRGDFATATRLLAAVTLREKNSNENTESANAARTLNLASVFECSGSSAVASYLVHRVSARVLDHTTQHTFNQRTALYRSGVALLRFGRPAAAACLIYENATGGVARDSDKWLRLAECAAGVAARGAAIEEGNGTKRNNGNDDTENGENEASRAFAAHTEEFGTVTLTFAGADACVALALFCLDKEESELGTESSTSKTEYRPRVKAQIHAQRAFVSLALGKFHVALQSAETVLAIVTAVETEKNSETISGAKAEEKKTKSKTKPRAVAEEGFTNHETKTFTRLGYRYAAEALVGLGPVEEAVHRLQVAGLE